VSAAGADVFVHPGVLHRPVAVGVRVRPTLSRGRARIPYKVFGKLRAFALHDYIVSKRLEALRGEIDIVHTWPLSAARTLKTAAKLGIPTVLERPNAHTRFAYESVREECRRMGIVLPPGHEYEYNEEILRKEEEEYRLAYRLLCPSDFVVKTFIDKGVPMEKLARHQYGFDEGMYQPPQIRRDPSRGLTMLFAGVCAVRKGLHYALDAWLRSSAHYCGTFLIAGEFLPAYQEKLSSMLSHPSVKVLGFRNDISELMQKSDVFILPSIEEGSALVASEARGSGCVLLVSEAAGAICKHNQDALVHSVGDVATLAEHITSLNDNRALLNRLRTSSLATLQDITWKAAGTRLLEVYEETIASKSRTASLQLV